MDRLIAKLYQSPKTIVTNKDMALIWEETNPNHLKSKIAYYAKHGALIRLTRGVFAKDRNYNPRELATSIYAPSYISFETVLRDAGMIFQHYETIYVAGPWPTTMTINNQRFTFRTLKKSVLYRPDGINNEHQYSIATPERAFLDMIYLFPDYYFDHLDSLNWQRCLELGPIYQNQRLIKRIRDYRKKYAE